MAFLAYPPQLFGLLPVLRASDRPTGFGCPRISHSVRSDVGVARESGKVAARSVGSFPLSADRENVFASSAIASHQEPLIVGPALCRPVAAHPECAAERHGEVVGFQATLEFEVNSKFASLLCPYAPHLLYPFSPVRFSVLIRGPSDERLKRH